MLRYDAAAIYYCYAVFRLLLPILAAALRRYADAFVTRHASTGSGGGAAMLMGAIEALSLLMMLLPLFMLPYAAASLMPLLPPL